MCIKVLLTFVFVVGMLHRFNRAVNNIPIMPPTGMVALSAAAIDIFFVFAIWRWI